MATNPDNTWEVVDGVQRLSSVAKFAGSKSLRDKLKVGDTLVLVELQKLREFEGMTYSSLPSHIQLHFRTRPLKVITLNDKSDTVVRYDLFERLNTGGIALSAQEIRDCIYQGTFSEMLEELATVTDFRTVLRLTERQERDGTAEECVLRFFAFLDRYKHFVHSVTTFLNNYMENSTRSFDALQKEAIFRATFAELASAFPHGLRRPGRRGTTPLNLYEGVSVGAALALRERKHLVTKGINQWLGHPKLREFTGAGSNKPAAVKGRIEFCRDRFLGKPYVDSSKG